MATTSKSTTPEAVLKQLEALGNPKVRERNLKHGVGENQFGVPMGDIRKLAAKIKTGQDLVMGLWDTENLEARLLAVLLMDPKKLTSDEVERFVCAVNHDQVADWLTAYVVKKHPDKEMLRQKWMQDDHPWAARAGWSLTSERISGSPSGLDFEALLDRIESEMLCAAPEVQWTMNFCLAGIGIHSSDHRERALAIGEKLGIYRDYPVSKGCTSPFAPLWIKEMVRRQKK